MNTLGTHLFTTIKKGGHGFSSRDIRGENEELLKKVHHFDHAHLQGTLLHRVHAAEIELERQLLLTQFWDGKQWRRQQREPNYWTEPTQQTITSEPDLAASLLEIVRVFGPENISYRLLQQIYRKQSA